MTDDPWLPARLRALRGFVTGEENVRRSYLQAAGNWAGRVRDSVLAPFRQAGHTPNAHAVTGQNDYWQQQLRELLRPTLVDVLHSGWANVRGQEPPSSFDASHQALRFLTDSENRMVRTPDEVYREIAAAIAAGIDEGLSIPNIADRVDELLRVTDTERWVHRATTVARTETQAAMQTGQLVAARARQTDEGVPYDKVWLSTEDDRTRPTHVLADLQRVPLAATFDVGDAHLDHPGDPTGPAHEVINCRCSLLFVAHSEPTTSVVDRQNP